MKTRRTSIRRLAAGAGALSLAMVGLAGTAASAVDPIEPDPANITGTTGTLTIHKHAGDPTAPEPGGDGTLLDPAPDSPLEGVSFSIQRVTFDDGTGAVPLNLLTAAGWDTAQDASPANVANGADGFGTSAADGTTSATTGPDGAVAVPGLPYGLYLVSETDPGDHNIVSPIAPFLVSIPYPSGAEWLYNVHVYPKNAVDTAPPTKEVTDPGHEVVVGDRVTWTISKTLPTLATGASFENVTVTDTLDPRLSIEPGDVTVTLDGGPALTLDTDYTVVVDGQDVTVELINDTLADLDGGEKLVVVLVTTVIGLGDNAEISNSALVNVNDTEYGTNKPAVYYGQIQVTKTDGANNGVLEGAVFDLYGVDEDGNRTGDPLGTATTNAAGQFDTPFSVWVGTDVNGNRDYMLVETQAPAGYVTPTGDAAETLVNVSVGDTAEVGYDVELTTETVENTKQKGPNLPLTGSTGTLLFTIVGIGLIATGGVIAAVRHNRSKA